MNWGWGVDLLERRDHLHDNDEQLAEGDLPRVLPLLLLFPNPFRDPSSEIHLTVTLDIRRTS